MVAFAKSLVHRHWRQALQQLVVAGSGHVAGVSAAKDIGVHGRTGHAGTVEGCERQQATVGSQCRVGVWGFDEIISVQGNDGLILMAATERMTVWELGGSGEDWSWLERQRGGQQRRGSQWCGGSASLVGPLGAAA